MYNEYGMTVEARLHLAELHRQAAADRLAAACPRPERARRTIRKAPSAPPVVRRPWRARLAWLFGS